MIVKNSLLQNTKSSATNCVWSHLLRFMPVLLDASAQRVVGLVKVKPNNLKLSKKYSRAERLLRALNSSGQRW